jgi:small subunit ribosomal protein S5
MTDEKDTKENKDTKEAVENTEKKDASTDAAKTDSSADKKDSAVATKAQNSQGAQKPGNFQNSQGGQGGYRGQGGQGGQKREFTKNRRNPRNRRGGKPRSEFEQKILDIRRVTRVSKGGRRFSFAVAVVVGNKKGKIGVGTGKAGDTSLAIDKAVKAAQKNTIVVKTTKGMSIPHEVEAKFNSARVIIMPAPGRGIIAGSALRDIIELGGLKDINGKIISGSKNKLNIAKAVMKAFSSLEETVKEVREPKTPTKDTKESKDEKKSDAKADKKADSKVTK